MKDAYEALDIRIWEPCFPPLALGLAQVELEEKSIP